MSVFREEMRWAWLVALIGDEPNGFDGFNDHPTASMAFAAHDAYWDWYDAVEESA